MRESARRSGSVIAVCMLLGCLWAPAVAAPVVRAAQSTLQSPSLLTVDHLPAGWSVVPSAIADGGLAAAVADATGCALPFALPQAGSTGVSGASFVLPHGQLSESIGETVETFAGGASTSLMASLQSDLSACVSSERTGDGVIGPSGAVIASSLTALLPADLGDDVLAYHLERTGDFTNTMEDLVVIRMGAAVMLLTHADQSFVTPAVDPALTWQIAQTAAGLLAPYAATQYLSIRRPPTRSPPST